MPRGKLQWGWCCSVFSFLCSVLQITGYFFVLFLLSFDLRHLITLWYLQTVLTIDSHTALLYLGVIKCVFFYSHIIYTPNDKQSYDTMYIMNNTQLQNKCGHRNVLSKRQVWMSIFHIINFKKNISWTQGSWIFLIKN